MGKSQLLRYAAQVAPRAVLTTGTGSTASGLTAAAVKADGGDGWSLEAGALVLADGGVCCIDEFDTISAGERAAIHEAMEQQTVSIAKSGMIATLHTRCAVLGATNPKGMKFDPTASLAVNTGLAPPLLSRFDCVLVLLDSKDSEQDQVVSSHIISSHCGERSGDAILNAASAVKSARCMGSATMEDMKMKRLKESSFGAGALQHLETNKGDNSGSGGFLDSGDISTRGKYNLWPFERVCRYVAHVRYAFDPVLTPEAEALIRGYYQVRRRTEDNSSARPTIRLLESLIRLTQAHARLMWRAAAFRGDVIVAVGLVEASFGGRMGALQNSPPWEQNISFADDPDGDALQRELQLMERITAELGPKWIAVYEAQARGVSGSLTHFTCLALECHP
jgi:DNA helicase MCM9